MKSYLELIRQYLENKISPEDREILKSWLEDDEKHKNVFKEEVHKWSTTKEEISTDPNKAYDRFVTTIREKENDVHSLQPWKKIIKYAAVLGGILIMGHYTFKSNFIATKNDNTVVTTKSPQEDKIKIVQEDGTITYIDSNTQSDIVSVNGIVIGTKEKDGLVVSSNKNPQVIEYIEISIPKGKLFQLVLSDGTKVWLNAASTLRFPQHFVTTEQNRTVYLQGEAFFDVTTNKEKPFIVKTNQMDVAVLGTQFNVSSYADDILIKTTLVEGAVAVNSANDIANRIQLTPGHQAIFSKGDEVLHKKKVDTRLFTSWMSRKLIITNQTFAEVTKRLERTYDVEIVSANERLNNTRFTGEFDIENIRQILNVFSQTIDFTYKIENKKITINP